MADNPITDDTNVVLYDDLGNKVDVILMDSVYRLAVAANIEDDQKITSNPFPGIYKAYFAENGGSPDMNVNGSSTPVTFTVVPGSGKILYIHTIDVTIEDASMSFSKFGGLTALTNGVDFKLKQNGLSEIDLATMKRNGDFYIFANDAFIESSSTDILVAHIRAKINSGTTFKLVDSNSDYFNVIINDDLTGLDVFSVLIRGYEVDE